MSRFNFAASVLLANVALNNAFLFSRIATPTRSFEPVRVKSYLDSLSQQPKSEVATSNIAEDPLPVVEQELVEFKESNEFAQLKEERPEQNLPKEGDAADAIAAINVEPDQGGTETTVELVKEELNPKLENPVAAKCDDEKISLTIAEAAKSTLGVNTSRNYRTTKQTLRESLGKNEKRLSRSSYVKEKSFDKISAIKKKAEEQVKIIERDLEEKLADIQENFDNEMIRIKGLLTSQLKIEASREEKIRALKSDLEGAIVKKNAEIETEDRITAEMLVVRSKLKSGNISNQLDELIKQKGQVAKFEQAQLTDLISFVQAAETILDDTTDRTNSIQAALSNMGVVDVLRSGTATYDFTELTELEKMWDDAAQTAEAENRKITQLKNKFDDELMNKILLLGEEVPAYLQAAASRQAIKKEAAAQVAQQRELEAKAASFVGTSSGTAMTGTFSRSDDMNVKNDYELFGIVAKSLSSAAIDSAKAGVFGIKAVLDTVQDEKVSEKMPSDSELNDDSIKAIGSASKTTASSVRKTESAAQANDALRETGEDFGAAFKAISALGRHAVERMRESEK